MLTINDYFIQDFIQDVLSYIGVKSNFIALDLGCGKHRYSIHYKKYNASIINTDILPVCEDLHCISDSMRSPFKESTFDIIFMCEVAEHLSDPSAAISEANRMLKSDGYLIVTIPFMYNLHDYPNDFFRFTEFYLESLLSKCQLNIERIIRRGDVFAVMHSIIGQLIVGFAEGLNRLPLVGKAFAPFNQLIKKCIVTSYRLHHFFLKDAKRLNPSSVGQGLSGPYGRLALWTLGYCVLARKN